MVGPTFKSGLKDTFMHTLKHEELLNPINGLVACPIKPTTDQAIIEESLDLTTRIFPNEPGARDRLNAVYDALSRNESVVDDFEPLNYYAYTMPQGGARKVVGIAGFYRLCALDDDARAMGTAALSFLARRLPEHALPVSAGGAATEETLCSLLWGGRMGISPLVSRSPAVSPFIYFHILSTALATIERLAIPPVILIFTRRDDNRAVRRLYKNMGFMDTGAELTYLDQVQSVLALHLHKDTPVLHVLEDLTQRALR